MILYVIFGYYRRCFNCIFGAWPSKPANIHIMVQTQVIQISIDHANKILIMIRLHLKHKSSIAPIFRRLVQMYLPTLSKISEKDLSMGHDHTFEMGQIWMGYQSFLAQKGFIGIWIFWMKCISERFTGTKSVFDWWMSAEWAARDEQPILPTSTNPCIPRAALLNRIK
jgi:hypothetical protein